MATQGGLGMELLVDGNQVSNDVGSISGMSCPVGQQDVTGLNSLAHERIFLLRDGMITFEPFLNVDTGAIHDVLSTLPTTDRIYTALVASTASTGPAQGDPAFCVNGKQLNYDPTRGADGAITFGTQGAGNGFGAEWGVILTDDGITTSTGAEDLGSLDLTTTSTDFGLQAYLHVTAFSGTDATITIEDSADDAAFAAVGGGAFTQITGVGAERIETGRTENVRRYLRCAISGGFSSMTFVVVVNRNPVAVVF